MKKTTTAAAAVLLLLAAVAGCDGGDGELAGPAEYSLGREIIETFAEYVGEDPSDIRVRDGAWEWNRLPDDYPDIAEAIEKHVEEAGIAFPAWTEDEFLPPRVPRVINFITSGKGWTTPPRTLRIGYGSGPQPCWFVMNVESFGDKWRVGDMDLICAFQHDAEEWKRNREVLP